MPSEAQSPSLINRLSLFEGKPTAAYLPEKHVCDKHVHKEAELAYVMSGKLKVAVRDSVLTAGEGEFICICGSMLHQYVYEDPGSAIIKVKFMKEWFRFPFLDKSVWNKIRSLYGTSFSTGQDPFISRIFADMIPPEKESCPDIHVFSRLLDLTLHLVHHSEIIRETVRLENTDTDYTEKMLQYVQENCDRPLTLPMLAEYLNLSESYCSKYFKKVVGLNFVDYVNALRVNNALYLLLNTNYSITRIVDEIGFGSVQSFNRVFRLQTGTTPSHYRQNSKGLMNL